MPQYRMHLDVKWIISHPDEFDLCMKNRNEPYTAASIAQAYNEWRASVQELEQVSANLNKLSKEFNAANRDLCKKLGDDKKRLEAEVDEKRSAMDYLLDRIPNMLDSEVPIGKTSDDNVILKYCNTKPEIENPIHHEDIAINLGLWGRDEAGHLSGSRFVILKDKLAKLERILVQFALDKSTAAGFMEMSVPFIVKQSSMYNTGQLPKFTENFFAFSDSALIPTGEVPLVHYVANRVMDHLPLKLTTHTPCFRKEAGSLGKDTKGLIRLHQFHKVELVAITTAGSSHTMHVEMLNHITHLLDLLELHYRIVEVCSGDIGFTATRQFDVEVWMPGQNKYVEVASCSNCGDFQARRMKTKYHKADGSTEFVHTLNCTAIACGRIIAAILENYCYNSEFVLPHVLYEYWK